MAEIQIQLQNLGVSQQQQAIGNGGSNQFLSTSLYAGYLEPTVSDGHNCFSEEKNSDDPKIGPVPSVRVCRDAITNANVNYRIAENDCVALRQFNFTRLDRNPINGRQVYVGKAEPVQADGKVELNTDFVQNSPESLNDEDFMNYLGEFKTSKMERIGKLLKMKLSNLYIKHLDDSIDDDKLRELFSVYGTITSCKVMRDNHGRSKGFGFADFSSPSEAARALAEMNRKIVVGKPLYVAPAERKDERRARLQAYFSQLSL